MLPIYQVFRTVQMAKRNQNGKNGAAMTGIQRFALPEPLNRLNAARNQADALRRIQMDCARPRPKRRRNKARNRSLNS